MADEVLVSYRNEVAEIPPQECVASTEDIAEPVRGEEERRKGE